MFAGLALVCALPGRGQLPNPFHKKAPKDPGAAGAPAAKGPVVPDVILRNGHIYTANPLAPWVEAVAIVGDHRVVGGGRREDYGDGG